MNEPLNNPASARLDGLDLARALAIFGMVIVNYKLVLGASEAGPDWLVWAVGLLQGRAAALFVVLAGVGIALMSHRARLSNDRALQAIARKTLLKRAAFLFIFGLLYTPIWPADILHFYGLYMIVGAMALFAPPKFLLRLAMAFIAIFVLLIILGFDYEAGWNWDTLDYAGFWTPAGLLRHMIFNGFHPLFPWAAFLLGGMALGQQHLVDRVVQNQFIRIGAVMALGAWALSAGLTTLSPSPQSDMAALAGLSPMPPMPLYLISAGGTALIIIMLCIRAMQVWPQAFALRALADTGRMALTHYVAHVVPGMLILESMGWLDQRTLPEALLAAFVFFGSAIVFSALWQKRFARGPMEMLMRRLTR